MQPNDKNPNFHLILFANGGKKIFKRKKKKKGAQLFPRYSRRASGCKVKSTPESRVS